MRLVWRKKPQQERYRLEAHELRIGERVLATVQRSDNGWFWHGMQRNTANRPRLTIDEAKADAETVVREMLRAADAAEAASG